MEGIKIFEVIKMKIYYTIPTNVSKENFSENEIGFDYKEGECHKIIKILRLYYELNKEKIPNEIKERLEDIVRYDDYLCIEENDLDFIGPILETFFYNNGAIEEEQVVGLMVDDCCDLNYLTLTSDYAYSFQVGLLLKDIKKVYYFSKYKNKIHPAVWHCYNNIFSDYTVVYENEEDRK